MVNKIKEWIYIVLITILLKVRWAWFHINPRYIKFYVTDDEAHFQDQQTGMIFCNYTIGKKE